MNVVLDVAFAQEIGDVLYRLQPWTSCAGPHTSSRIGPCARLDWSSN